MADQVSGWLSPLLRRRRQDAATPWLKGRVLDVGCGSGTLAGALAPERYLGLDVDAESIARARLQQPNHRFVHVAPSAGWGDLARGNGFDTVVMLAVIEHVPDPTDLLRRAAASLTPDGRIVATVPEPAFEWAHGLGARLGLLSPEASEEHEAPIGRQRMQSLAEVVGLRVVHFRRFLCGANQLFVLESSSG